MLAQQGDDAGRCFALAIGDVDYFKRINDAYSHQVGDEVLRRVGAAMRDVVRGEDIAGRYGGEEFLLVLSTRDQDEARQVCERVRSVVSQLPWHEVAAGLAVSISFGVALRRPGEPAQALLSRADALLYRAKAGGRNRVSCDEGT